MFRTLGIFLFCFCASASSGLLGAKKCTYGPSFWCESLKNAKSCGAVRHCIDTIWEKQILPKDDGNICKLCKDMVTQAREQLESPENQALLKQVFEQSCRLIPFEEIQKECIIYADEFVPELIETLASQMNPQVVCATVGLCNSARINRLEHENKALVITELKPINLKRNTCTDCENFLTDVRNVALSIPREELLTKMLQMCGRLDALADGCMALVEVNFSIFYAYIENEFDAKQACEFIGFCDRMYGGHVTKLSHKTGNEICDFCESIVQHYKDTLSSNTSKAEFKEILSGICHSTGHFSHECLALVDQYYEIIYDLLISEVDAQKICEAIGLCGPSSVFKNDFSTWTLFNIKPEQHLPLIPLEEPSQNNGVNYFNIMIPRNNEQEKDINIIPMADTGLLTPELENKADNECMMCEFVLHFLQDFLQEKQTRAEIKTALDNVCSLMPHSVAEQCQDYIDAYGDQLIQFVIYEMDPSAVCPMLHLCPSEATTLLSATESDICLTCEFVITVVDEMLNNNVMRIESALTVVCNVLPSSVRPECIRFVDEYGKDIIQYLEHEASPEMICTLMKLCHKPSGTKYDHKLLENLEKPKAYTGINYAKKLRMQIETPIVKETDVALTESTGCVLCEFVMRELDQFLLFPATKERIEGAVERVCLVLPGSLRADCLSFLEKYTTLIVDLLVEKIDPDLICRKAKICKQITTGMPLTAVSLKSEICEVCEQVMSTSSKQHQITADNLIMDSCSKMVDTSKEKLCQDFVKAHVTVLKPMLDELISPKKVCIAMEKCPNIVKRELLGKKKCTWGPSYWCQSEWHANSCNATKHCEEKVWTTQSDSH